MLTVEVDVSEVHDGVEAQSPEAGGVAELEPSAVPRDTVELQVTLGLPQRGHADRHGLQVVEGGALVIAGKELPRAVEAGSPGRVEGDPGVLRRPHACCDVTGPDPAPVRAMASVSSARSSSVSRSDADGSQPSTWSGRRAPTMAAVTPGQASVHETATAPGETPWRAATGSSAAASSRLRVRLSPVKSSWERRQSSSGMAATRSAVIAPVRSPDCMGL